MLTPELFPEQPEIISTETASKLIFASFPAFIIFLSPDLF